jgi:hypothetical protein
MTVKKTIMAIADYNQKINGYERKIDNMQPAFLYDYDEIDTVERNLCEAVACRASLIDMLIGGGVG